MIKKVFFALLQLVLFVSACMAGIVLASFHALPSHITPLADGTRGFQWEGVVLMTVVFAIILAIEAARKRIGTAGPWTFLAFVVALLVAAKLSLLSLT